MKLFLIAKNKVPGAGTHPYFTSKMTLIDLIFRTNIAVC